QERPGGSPPAVRCELTIGREHQEISAERISRDDRDRVRALQVNGSRCQRGNLEICSQLPERTRSSRAPAEDDDVLTREVLGKGGQAPRRPQVSCQGRPGL